MGKIAFVFSGQGDQYPGMGKELYDSSAAARQIFELCERLRPGTMKQCFSGTEEELKETANTQPCLYAMELAGAAMLRERGIHPAAAAGFSLGEVTAAAAAGFLDPENGFRLVCRRGMHMQQAAEEHDTAMAAVLKLSAEQVQEICGRLPGVYPVNFNCPGQITVSGPAEQLPGLCEQVNAAGGRAMQLKVRGAFHSPYMKKAAEAFAEDLVKAPFSQAGIPLYSNVTAEVYEGDPRALLARQIESPVQWERLIRNMRAAGAEIFIEIGPGKTLTNMIRRIDPAAAACSIAEMEQVMEAVSC